MIQWHGWPYCRNARTNPWPRSSYDQLSESLAAHGYRAAALHGGLTQEQRDRVMRRFRDGSLELLIATDVAARGLDIERLPHVVNYDLPQVPEDYVHRIGRTGRAGEDGVALSLVCPEEKGLLLAIEKLLKYAIPRQELEEFPKYAAQRVGKPKDSNKSKKPSRARKTTELSAPAAPGKTSRTPAKSTTPQRKKVVAERPAPKTGRRGQRA